MPQHYAVFLPEDLQYFFTEIGVTPESQFKYRWQFETLPYYLVCNDPEPWGKTYWAKVHTSESRTRDRIYRYKTHTTLRLYEPANQAHYWLQAHREPHDHFYYRNKPLEYFAVYAHKPGWVSLGLNADLSCLP